MNESSQLQGLIIPPNDVGFNTELWLGLLLLACLMGLIAWRWNKKRIKNRALVRAQRSLHALQNSYKEKNQSSHFAALELVSILCKGLDVKRLDQYQADDVPKWQLFHQKLNTLCYSKDSLNQSKIKLAPLFKETKQWLSESE